jgi:hypothetical protein
MEGDPNVIETKSTVEVLDTKGETMNRADSPLSGMFDKIEQGKADGKSAADVIKEVSTEPVKEQEKKVEAKKEINAPAKEKTEIEKKVEAKPTEEKADENSRKGLFDKLEEKTKPVEEKKEEKKEEAKKEEGEVPEEELQVLPHDKPKTAKRIQALLKRIDTVNSEVTKTRAEAKEKADKLAELEKKLGEVKTVDPKTEEAVKQQRDELAMYRRRYDLEKDPEVKTKFDSRIESSEKSVLDSLSKAGLGQPLLDVIKEHGGWMKFAESNTPLTLKDGKVSPASDVAEAILQMLPLAQRKGIEAAMMEQIQTKRDRDRYFQEEQAKASEYFKKKDEEAAKGTEAYQQQVKEAAGKIEGWHKEVTTKNEWLREKEIPANATPEQKAAIEEDNKYTRQLNQVLKNSLSAKTIEESLDIVFDSVRFYQERREKAKLQKELETARSELKAKQAEIDKFKGGGRSTPKAGSIATPSQDKTNKNDRAPVGLEAAFAAIDRGEKLTAQADDGDE